MNEVAICDGCGNDCLDGLSHNSMVYVKTIRELLGFKCYCQAMKYVVNDFVASNVTEKR